MEYQLWGKSYETLHHNKRRYFGAAKDSPSYRQQL